MALASDIKTQIQTLLLELKTAGTLGEVVVDDFKQSIMERIEEAGAYPIAILSTPAIESEAETNRDNTRTHIFEIWVVAKGEDIGSATDIEDLVEAILDKFDNNPSLGGNADAGVEPSTSLPEAFVSGDKSFIAFAVTVRAKAVKALTY